MLVEFDECCYKELGIKPIEAPLPFGLSGTDQFYEAFSETYDIPKDTLTPALKGVRNQGVHAIETFHAQNASNRSFRYSYNIGSLRSFDLPRIALEELGHKPILDAIGIQTVLYIQGPKHQENIGRRRLRTSPARIPPQYSYSH